MKKTPPIILGLLIILIFIFFYNKKYKDGDVSTTTPVSFEEGTLVEISEKEDDGEFYLYKNNRGKFSLKLPNNISYKEYDEGKGAYSVVFLGDTGDKSFQVFFTPYKENSISKERFLIDNPSGIIREQKDVLIDGVTATMFFSENNIMGHTREVWFIKDGYLYEVMTYKSLDSWLSNIMLTWKFDK